MIYSIGNFFLFLQRILDVVKISFEFFLYLVIIRKVFFDFFMSYRFLFCIFYILCVGSAVCSDDDKEIDAVTRMLGDSYNVLNIERFPSGCSAPTYKVLVINTETQEKSYCVLKYDKSGSISDLSNTKLYISPQWRNQKIDMGHGFFLEIVCIDKFCVEDGGVYSLDEWDQDLFSGSRVYSLQPYFNGALLRDFISEEHILLIAEATARALICLTQNVKVSHNDFNTNNRLFIKDDSEFTIGVIDWGRASSKDDICVDREFLNLWMSDFFAYELIDQKGKDPSFPSVRKFLSVLTEVYDKKTIKDNLSTPHKRLDNWFKFFMKVLKKEYSNVNKIFDSFDKFSFEDTQIELLCLVDVLEEVAQDPGQFDGLYQHELYKKYIRPLEDVIVVEDHFNLLQASMILTQVMPCFVYFGCPESYDEKRLSFEKTIWDKMIVPNFLEELASND